MEDNRVDKLFVVNLVKMIFFQNIYIEHGSLMLKFIINVRVKRTIVLLRS